MKREVVLDPGTDRMLDLLASNYPGGANSVVKDAIRVYAAAGEHLEEIVSEPGLRDLMRRSAKDIRMGQVLPHREAMALVRARRKNNAKA